MLTQKFLLLLDYNIAASSFFLLIFLNSIHDRCSLLFQWIAALLLLYSCFVLCLFLLLRMGPLSLLVLRTFGIAALISLRAFARIL
ncbi:hypothetical protein LguiA_009942 [Lonicera macranthoides]